MEDFANLDLGRLKTLLRYPIIIDGRNLYSCGVMKEYGFHYVSIGRPDVELSTSAVFDNEDALSPTQ